MDKEGKRMDQGGGTILLKGNEQWPGVGHNSVYTFGNKDYMVFHTYDAHNERKPKLKISELTWDADGWPVTQLKWKFKF